MITSVLRVGVLISLTISLALLTTQVLKTLPFGRRRLHSPDEGSRSKGITYAFIRGMMPWEKESAARHLPTYVAGMIYHAGIFAAIFWALCLAGGIRLPRAVLTFVQFLMAAGFLSGTGLFLRRVIRPGMRYISCPDDYVSNLLVDGFVFSGLLASWLTGVKPVFLIVAMITFLYMPLGKIRHCFFFFYSRLLFGTYFGRRGVLPRQKPAQAKG